MKQREVEKALEYLREYDTVRSKDSINFIEKWKNNAEKELEVKKKKKDIKKDRKY